MGLHLFVSSGDPRHPLRGQFAGLRVATACWRRATIGTPLWFSSILSVLAAARGRYCMPRLQYQPAVIRRPDVVLLTIALLLSACRIATKIKYAGDFKDQARVPEYDDGYLTEMPHVRRYAKP